MIPWHKALKRYRLTPAQLPGVDSWTRRRIMWCRRHNGHFSYVPMVRQADAEAAHRRAWARGDAERAKTRAKKKKRRRQRDAAVRRKAYNEVRGFAAFTSCLRAGVVMIASYVTSVLSPEWRVLRVS